jgi:transposase-like protein
MDISIRAMVTFKLSFVNFFSRVRPPSTSLGRVHTSTMGAKSRFTLVKKEEIVAEAYSKPGNVRATGRLYGVQLNNIQYWAKTIQEARNAMLPSKFTKARGRLTLNPGKSAKHHESDNILHGFLQNIREQHLKVTVRLMCAEYKRVNMEDCAILNFVICQRIY